jgi:uncharacterized protein YkwD
MAMTMILLLFITGTSALFFDPPAIVTQVNKYRQLHKAPHVTYNNTLTASIQKWTDHLAATNTFYHSTTPYGENLGMTHFGGQEIERSKGNITKYVQDIVTIWYDEVQFYNWNQPGYSYITGHFTQLVWVKSRRIGVGVSYSKANNKLYVGMAYDPPGNYIGDFQKNVLPKISKPVAPKQLPRKCV